MTSSGRISVFRIVEEPETRREADVPDVPLSLLTN